MTTKKKRRRAKDANAEMQAYKRVKMFSLEEGTTACARSRDRKKIQMHGEPLVFLSSSFIFNLNSDNGVI